MPPAVPFWVLCTSAGWFVAHVSGFDGMSGAALGSVASCGITLWEHWKEMKAEQVRRFQAMCEQEEKRREFSNMQGAAVRSGLAQTQTTTIATGLPTYPTSAMGHPNLGAPLYPPKPHGSKNPTPR